MKFVVERPKYKEFELVSFKKSADHRVMPLKCQRRYMLLSYEHNCSNKALCTKVCAEATWSVGYVILADVSRR